MKKSVIVKSIQVFMVAIFIFGCDLANDSKDDNINYTEIVIKNIPSVYWGGRKIEVIGKTNENSTQTSFVSQKAGLIYSPGDITLKIKTPDGDIFTGSGNYYVQVSVEGDDFINATSVKFRDVMFANGYAEITVPLTTIKGVANFTFKGRTDKDATVYMTDTAGNYIQSDYNRGWYNPNTKMWSLSFEPFESPKEVKFNIQTTVTENGQQILYWRYLDISRNIEAGFHIYSNVDLGTINFTDSDYNGPIQ